MEGPPEESTPTPAPTPTRFVGPSACVLRVLPEGASIAPGESVDAPLVLRCGGSGGLEALRLILRYLPLRAVANADRAAPSPFAEAVAAVGGDPLRHRMLRTARLQLPLVVLPSLSAAATAEPSRGGGAGDHVLTLEASNYRTDGDDQSLRITSVACVSDRWTMEPLAGGALDAALPLAWQETAALHLRLSPVAPGGPRHSARAAPAAAPCSLRLLAADCSAQRSAALRERLAREDEERRREASRMEPRSIQEVRRAAQQRDGGGGGGGDGGAGGVPPGAPGLHPCDVRSAMGAGASQVHVVVGWEAEGAGGAAIEGQHHVMGVVVRPGPGPRTCPLSMRATHAQEATHDFAGGDACVVDVAVGLRNRLFGEGAGPISFVLEAVEDVAAADLGVQQRLLWAGPTRVSVEGLAPGEEREVVLQAHLTAPGAYDLNLFKVTVGEEPYTFPHQCLVTVRGA